MIKRILAIALMISLLLISLTCFSSCSEGKRTAMTVGDYKVSYDMLRYFTMNYINEYSGVDAEDFANNEDLQKELTDNVISSISELAAYRLLAKKYDIKLTKEEKDSIKNDLKEMKKEYDSEKAYKKDLESNFITEDVYKEIMTIELLCDKLYDYLTSPITGIFKTDNDTIDADIEAGNFFSAEYSVIFYTSENKAEREAFMQSLLEGVENGESLRDLTDSGYTSYGEQLSYELYSAFTYTEKTEIFEKTVEGLKVGEYSSVVDTGSSLMIVHRLELDSKYVEENYDTIIAKYLSREFFGYVSEFSKDLKVEFKKKYKDLKLWEME